MSQMMWGKSGAVYNNFFCVLCKTRRYDLTCLISPFLLTKLASFGKFGPFHEPKSGTLDVQIQKWWPFFVANSSVQFNDTKQCLDFLFTQSYSCFLCISVLCTTIQCYAMHGCKAGYDEEYVLRCTLEERCPVIGEVQLGQKLYPPNRPLSPPAVWANRGFLFGENLQNLQNIHISDGNCFSGMLWLRPHTFWPDWKVLRPEHLSRRVAEEENRELTLRTPPPP